MVMSRFPLAVSWGGVSPSDAISVNELSPNGTPCARGLIPVDTVTMTTPKRILLIDDDPVFTRAVKLLLEDSGNYSIEEENNSRNAFATSRWFRPDLIFLDVMMPDLDGGDIARQIEADALLQGTPIVFFTGLVSEEEAVSHRIGGYRFIAKPLRGDQLVSCVEEILKIDRPSSSDSAMPTNRTPKTTVIVD